MHFPKKDVIEGLKGPCKNKLQTQPSSFVSLSLSFADDVHPEGSPGSCWGWTLALDHSLVLKYLVLGIPFPPVMQESLLNFYLPGFKYHLVGSLLLGFTRKFILLANEASWNKYEVSTTYPVVYSSSCACADRIPSGFMPEPTMNKKRIISVCVDESSLDKALLESFFLKYMYILLKYSWLTMFQVHSKVIQLHKYIYIIFEIIFHPRLLQGIDSGYVCYMVNLYCLLHIYFLN